MMHHHQTGHGREGELPSLKSDALKMPCAECDMIGRIYVGKDEKKHLG